MFENYKQMSADEQAQVKAIHKAIRTDDSFGDRYRILAWGFIRGFKFRRLERSHHMEKLPDGHYSPAPYYIRTDKGVFYEHNLPEALPLTKLLAKHLPEFQADFESKWSLKSGTRIAAWLEDKSGAIHAPPPRPKKPYVRAEEATASP
jgi:hypothetical protein